MGGPTYVSQPAAPPPPPPNPPTAASSAVQASAAAAARNAAAQAGRGKSGTLLTGSDGAPAPATAKKQLLGD